jgi:hypothetical protein
MPEQIDDLFESRMLSEGVDVVALVAEDSEISVNETNVGLGCDDALESRLCNRH